MEKSGKKKIILFGLSGTGFFDMTAYQSYNNKTMNDQVPSDSDLERGFASIPNIPQNS